MDRQTILTLRNPRWELLFDVKNADGTLKCDIEVQLVPSEMPDLTSSKLLGQTSQMLEADICSKAFVDFKNFTEDGEAVPNTLDTRLELYRVPVFRQAINNALQAANNEVVLGEGDAASA